MRWFLRGFKLAWTWKGRASRREFWSFFLISFLFGFAGGFAQGFCAKAYGPEHISVAYANVATGLFVLTAFFPGLAVSVRRLHDVGWSGAWTLLLLVPYLGAAALFVVYLLPGQRGPNKYGPSPAQMQEPPMSQAAAPSQAKLG